MNFIILFFSSIASIVVLDMIWLGAIAKNLYMDNLGVLLRKSNGTMSPIIWPAIIVYICIALGILFFVLPKAHGDYKLAFVYGALLGGIIYGVYEFTNYSILAHWPLNITFIDFMWGIILCALTSVFVTFIHNQFLA